MRKNLQIFIAVFSYYYFCQQIIAQNNAVEKADFPRIKTDRDIQQNNPQKEKKLPGDYRPDNNVNKNIKRTANENEIIPDPVLINLFLREKVFGQEIQLHFHGYKLLAFLSEQHPSNNKNIYRDKALCGIEGL